MSLSQAKIQLRSEVIEVTYGEERVPDVVSIGSANHFVGDFNPDPSFEYESSFMRHDRLMDLRIAKCGDITLPLQPLFIAIHRTRNIDGKNELKINDFLVGAGSARRETQSQRGNSGDCETKPFGHS